MSDVDALTAGVARLHWRLQQLEQTVARFARRPDDPAGLGPLLARIYRFALSTTRTAGETVQRLAPVCARPVVDARSSDRRPWLSCGPSLEFCCDGMKPSRSHSLVLEHVRLKVGVWRRPRKDAPAASAGPCKAIQCAHNVA
jgi:hypothetical protein